MSKCELIELKDLTPNDRIELAAPLQTPGHVRGTERPSQSQGVLLVGNIVGVEGPSWYRPTGEAGEGHDFQPCSHTQLTWCDLCGDFIWGLYKQSLRCANCGYTCHYRCQNLIQLDCSKDSLSKDPHDFSEDTIETDTNVPSMPQGKGPLVLRTNVQFSVKTRLLVKFPELNHSMKVNVSVDRIKGEYLVKPCRHTPSLKPLLFFLLSYSRRFNVLGANSKPLNMAESMTGGMVADFRHLTLKEQKSGGSGKGVTDISLSVTEELHVISFDTVFNLHGWSVNLETSSLPVVIISNSSQQQSAWASVLWFNMLCHDPKNTLFFANSPLAPWPQLGDMLSWQFLSATKRGLEPNQLEMIALKLFGKQQSYDACQLSWSKFCKENCSNVNFPFWVWYDGILVMVKTYLEDLWKDGTIMGFVSKAKEKSLLKRKQRGTFLLRFSESVRDGGITFSWVDYSVTGEPDVRSVQPFTKSDLGQIPFHEILRNFQILEAENVPVNPLVYLYPDTPKDEAFGKYYAEYRGDNSPYIKYIKTKLVFISKENTLEAKSAASPQMVEGDCLEPLNSAFEEFGGESRLTSQFPF
ncbi:signal transducer and activator of transcription 3-like [Aplochiton taeniatus]